MAGRPPSPTPLISDQLRAVIHARGMTAYALAAEAGVGRSQITRFLAGQRGLSLDSADRLCRALRLKLVETGRKR